MIVSQFSASSSFSVPSVLNFFPLPSNQRVRFTGTLRLAGHCLSIDPPPLVTLGRIGLCFASILGWRGRSKLRKIARKLAAVVALLALLLPGVSALAETLSAADLPACCNTAYCPVHHHQGRNLQKDKNNCDAMGIPGQNDCSMRACDAAPNSVVGTAAFVLVTPVALRGPIAAEAAPALPSQFFPFVATIPLTPPPRTFLS
jgi:hypothetical protein